MRTKKNLQSSFKERFIKKLSSVRWIYYISKRFSKSDAKGRTSVTSLLASLGIAFGVLSLIVIISVMNGFQREFIDSVMEISSYHLQVHNVKDESSFLSWCNNFCNKKGEKNISTVVPFYEAKGLLVHSDWGDESASLIRALPENIMELDSGFKKEVQMVSGEFDILTCDTIVLGYDLAEALNAEVGDTVLALALSGSSENALFSKDREFYVTGIFYANYQDINSAYAFVNLEAGKKYFGKNISKSYGIKLFNSSKDSFVKEKISSNFAEVKIESWREYNRTFFGALQVEKNVLMLLVFLIFVVVAVNIYNSMRRIVYERKEDFAILSSLGALPFDLQAIFIIKGFCNGFFGSTIGLIFALFSCINIKSIFLLLSKVQYFFQYFFTALLNPKMDLSYLRENPMFNVYAAIPAKMVLQEIVFIFLFGLFSSVIASWIAAKQIINLSVSEVLHDE